MTTQPKYDTESLWQKDRDHYIHPWTDFSTFKEEGSMVMANSEGAYVIDSDGKRYIDGIGGLWCNNIGYANEEMAEAIADQVRQIHYYSVFGHLTTPPAAESVPEFWPGSCLPVWIRRGSRSRPLRSPGISPMGK